MVMRSRSHWPKLMLGMVIMIVVLLMATQPSQPSIAQGPTRTPAGRSPIDRRLATISALAGVHTTLSGQLVYISQETGYYELFSMDLETGKTTQLTSDRVNKWWPAWSHDGTRIAFVKDVPEEQQDAIYIMDADGGNERRVTQPGLNFICVDWSPDDTQLVMCGGAGAYESVLLDIYTINVDGTGLKQLTDYAGKDYEPQWSPDGQYIAFSSDRDRPRDYNGEYGQVYVMRTDGSELRLLTDSGYASFAPGWSRDSKMIAYTGDCQEPTTGTVCIMNADGTDKRALTASKFDVAPRWSPDDKYIVVSRLNQEIGFAGAELHVLSVFGDEDRQITDNQWMDLLANWK